MKVLLFGATGMVGQGVLRECLLASDVASVVTIGRKAVGQQQEKLQELVHENLFDYSSIENQLTGFDACFFCLGVSSAGMSEKDYRHITYDLTLATAQTLARLNPQMTFIYVSGAGADSSEKGGSMWARVRGKTENDLFKLPFKAAYVFRPAAIQPLHGIKSKTAVYQFFYTVFGWILPFLKSVFPQFVTTTEQIGLAMLKVVHQGYPKSILESADINKL